jgi:hypothetical protein
MSLFLFNEEKIKEMKKLGIVSIFEDIGKEEIIQISELLKNFESRKILPVFYLLLNSENSKVNITILKSLFPTVVFNVYNLDFLNRYSSLMGVSYNEINHIKEKDNKIYQMLFLHFLYQRLGEKYVLLFKGGIIKIEDLEFYQILKEEIPFSVFDNNHFDYRALTRISKFCGETLIRKMKFPIHLKSNFYSLSLESVFKNFNKGSGIIDMISLIDPEFRSKERDGVNTDQIVQLLSQALNDKFHIYFENEKKIEIKNLLGIDLDHEYKRIIGNSQSISFD